MSSPTDATNNLFISAFICPVRKKFSKFTTTKVYKQGATCKSVLWQVSIAVICNLYIFVKQENSEKKPLMLTKKLQRKTNKQTKKTREVEILKMFLHLVKGKIPMRGKNLFT